MPELENISTEVTDLLKQLIETPSISQQEAETANLLAGYFSQKGIPVHRSNNNIWVKSKHWRDGQPVLLLNSHHDTVKPVEGWTIDPFCAAIENGQLFGLGSNDAGGSLVSMIAAFLLMNGRSDLPYNMILAATAEEEISGPLGISSILQSIGPVFAGIVGEPTSLQMATAEKGLMVIDAFTSGIAGHAARDNGENALYKAIEEIREIKNTPFPKISSLLGRTSLSVTQIMAGTQHNVIPDSCRWVIDVRTNEYYTNQDVFDMLQSRFNSKLTARSFRLNSSGIDENHVLVKAGLAAGLSSFGSPTLSDQALMDFPTIKLGCGDSTRSHTPNEFIYIDEINEGIKTYLHLLEKLAEKISSVNHKKTYTTHAKTLG